MRSAGLKGFGDGGSDTAQPTRRFIECVRQYENLPLNIPVKIYGDASGNSQSSKTSRTDYELIKEVFRKSSRFDISLHQNKANPVVRDRVNTLNNVLCNSYGERNVLIDPQCTELLKDLRQVRWKRDAAGNVLGELDKSDPERTHASDALSYLVAKEFGLKSKVGGYPGFMQ